jgi:hypothetical protein
MFRKARNCFTFYFTYKYLCIVCQAPASFFCLFYSKLGSSIEDFLNSLHTVIYLISCMFHILYFHCNRFREFCGSGRNCLLGPCNHWVWKTEGKTAKLTMAKCGLFYFWIILFATCDFVSLFIVQWELNQLHTIHIFKPRIFLYLFYSFSFCI